MNTRQKIVNALRWAVGLKLRALGDASFRLGTRISEGTSTGIAEECDVSYLWGFEAGQKMAKQDRPREEYLAFLVDCHIDRQQAERFLDSILPSGGTR